MCCQTNDVEHKAILDVHHVDEEGFVKAKILGSQRNSKTKRGVGNPLDRITPPVYLS